MSASRRILLTSSIAVIFAIVVRVSLSPSPSQCRVIPRDAAWPSTDGWDSFNTSVGGKLIATIPIGAPCHQIFSSGSNISTYDQAQCDALRNTWFFPETHLVSSSSPMAYQFGNNTCNPWSSSDTPCILGGQVVYSVNATSYVDIQKAIQFSEQHNIRLVIRNTGHDYLGKSTGAHALAIWTHYMKDIKLIERYDGKNYSGPALKVGAGVEGIEAYEFASANKLMVVGGNCPTVGLAGGFTQGGGHGHLASKYGLSADQVLEWEVVTGTGEHVIANSESHPDLYWALRGGGGSTFGVVVSMTIKAYPDTFFSTAYATVLNDGTNTDALWEAVGVFIKTLPRLVDSGVYVVWVAVPFGFLLMPAIGPDLHQNDLDELLQPFTDKLGELGLQYDYQSWEKPTFLANYQSLTASWNVSDYNLGGRLIPRSLIEENPQAFTDAVRFIGSQTIISGVTFNVDKGVASPNDVAVNPYFRKALMGISLGTSVDYTNWTATLNGQDIITNVFLPKLAALAPQGGAYLNEADFQASDFKSLFYGPHYDKLSHIKSIYDPNDIFYARTAVGSDRWFEDAEGRLCKV
ncbi:FAD-binding domain-containing protein [Periconia macrospinosa]|uniref:FAD-binding domain-containing protein n=1 Tax=Periconia macrospinosa TaxID=97972 RepID=A0A2V1D4F1_9PLEO|nr:FAD-binding domain-containing protein [Periconia macrospinosa]